MSGSIGQKDKNSSGLTVFIVIGIAVFLICLWGGYILEITSSPKKGIQPEKALAAAADNMNIFALGNAVTAAATGNGMARKGLVFGFAGGGLIVLYKMSITGKRYHRKGVEHGSARWGNKREKDIIADTNDFYNNVIAASDVFLVLDRKKREENEKENSKSRNKKPEKVKSEKNSPVGNQKGGSDVDRKKKKLFTVREAAQLIDGLTEYRIRQMCKSGQLPHISAGRKFLISEDVLMRVVFGVDINNNDT